MTKYIIMKYALVYILKKTPLQHDDERKDQAYTVQKLIY